MWGASNGQYPLPWCPRQLRQLSALQGSAVGVCGDWTFFDVIDGSDGDPSGMQLECIGGFIIVAYNVFRYSRRSPYRTSISFHDNLYEYF